MTEAAVRAAASDTCGGREASRRDAAPVAAGARPLLIATLRDARTLAFIRYARYANYARYARRTRDRLLRPRHPTTADGPQRLQWLQRLQRLHLRLQADRSERPDQIEAHLQRRVVSEALSGSRYTRYTRYTR